MTNLLLVSHCRLSYPHPHPHIHTLQAGLQCCIAGLLFSKKSLLFSPTLPTQELPAVAAESDADNDSAFSLSLSAAMSTRSSPSSPTEMVQHSLDHLLDCMEPELSVVTQRQEKTNGRSSPAHLNGGIPTIMYEYRKEKQTFQRLGKRVLGECLLNQVLLTVKAIYSAHGPTQSTNIV